MIVIYLTKLEEKLKKYNVLNFDISELGLVDIETKNDEHVCN